MDCKANSSLKSLCKCSWDFGLFFSQIKKKKIASNKFLCTGIIQKSFSSARQFCTFIPFAKLILAHKDHCRDYNSVTWFSHLIAEWQGQLTEEGVPILGGHPENKFCGMVLQWLNCNFAHSNLVLWELMLSKNPWNHILFQIPVLPSQLVFISTFLKLCTRH